MKRAKTHQRLRWTATQLDEGEWKVEWKTDDLYTINHTYLSHSQPHGACTVLTPVWEEFLSVALWKPLSRRSKRWPSLTFWYTSVIKSEAAYVIRRLTSRCLERKQPSRVGGSPLCVWSAHFFVTHIQTEKISSWNDPTGNVFCFMLSRASTKTFVSRVQKTAKKIFVSRKIR
jgi:hypothetical protein